MRVSRHRVVVTAPLVLALLGTMSARSEAYDTPPPNCRQSTFAEQQAWCNAEGIEGEVRPFECEDGSGVSGPYGCSAKCEDGVYREPLECIPIYGIPPGEDTSPVESASKPCLGLDPEECPFELVGEYNTCGGRMYPAVIDDEDNLYFFTARGRLHSVDKQGKFRWRMDLCHTPPSQYGGMEQQYLTAQEYPLVMDYHGTLYFFIGDVLYGVSQDGDVLLQHRVILPGIQPDPLLRKYRGDTDPEEVYSYEELVYGIGDEVQIPAIAPILDTEGRLYVAYRLNGYYTPRPSVAGYAQLDRLGNVLSHHLDYRASVNVLIGDREGRVVGLERIFAPADGRSPCDPNTPTVDASYLVSYSDEEKWVRRSTDWITAWWSTSPVVGANGALYVISGELGGSRPVRYGHEADPVKLAAIAAGSEFDRSRITSSNYLLVDRDGYMYVERDLGFATGIGLVAFDPVKVEAEADPDVYLLDQPDKGYLWGLNLDAVRMNYGTPALTAAGNMYVPIGSSIVALKLQPSGAPPEVLWSYTTNGGVYPTVVHVLSDGTLVFGNSEGMLYFVKEKSIENGGLDLQAAWPRPYHDNYRSNNAAHPMKWDRTKPAPYPSLQELLAGAPDGWNCNVDTRCFPKKYHETCDWGWPAALESQEIPCTDPEAENIPCPDPRRYTCLAKDKVAVHPCDADTDPGEDKPKDCNCATPGVSSRSLFPWLGLLLALGALAAIVLRVRRR